jgi:hypothetical protein
MEWFNYSLLWTYIKTCSGMPLHTVLRHYLFIYMLLTHYPLQHFSLLNPRMEWASILQPWSVSKAEHLFGAEHIWKEMLGLSWQCHECRCKLVHHYYIYIYAIHYLGWWSPTQKWLTKNVSISWFWWAPKSRMTDILVSHYIYTYIHTYI